MQRKDNGGGFRSPRPPQTSYCDPILLPPSRYSALVFRLPDLAGAPRVLPRPPLRSLSHQHTTAPTRRNGVVSGATFLPKGHQSWRWAGLLQRTPEKESESFCLFAQRETLCSRVCASFPSCCCGAAHRRLILHSLLALRLLSC